MASVYARKLENVKYQQEERQVQVQPVPKKQWITKGEKITYSLISVVVIAISLYVVSFSTSIDSVNRDIQQLESTVTEQMVMNDTLKAQKAELSEPSRILEEAKKHGLDIRNSQVVQANTVQ